MRDVYKCAMPNNKSIEYNDIFYYEDIMEFKYPKKITINTQLYCEDINTPKLKEFGNKYMQGLNELIFAYYDIDVIDLTKFKT